MVLALAVAFIVSAAAPVQAAMGQWSGWPTADSSDGRFIDVSGPRFATPYIPTELYIAVPSDATAFEVEVFDGDAGLFGGAGATFDLMGIPETFTYSLFADPLKSGAAGPALVTNLSTSFADAAWSSFGGTRPVDAAAMAPSGHYFYRMYVTYDGSVDDDFFLNAFKVRARSDSPTGVAQVGVVRQVSVIGAPINLTTDPALDTTNNTFLGGFSFFVDVNKASTSVRFSDQDADYRLDADSPGIPLDDSPNVLIRRSPDIRYELQTPAGATILFNTDPSGNLETEHYDYAVAAGVPLGIYPWLWTGVDAGNTFSVYVDYELLPEQYDPRLRPYLVGDTVWLDFDADGIEDAGEPGIPGVVVDLYDENGVFVATTTTDADGMYDFGVDAGEYTVRVADSNFDPGGALEQLSSSTGNEATKTVINTNVLTYDFGYYGDGTIGDLVWIDSDSDGTFDPVEGEIGRAGVKVVLSVDLDGDGVTDATKTTFTDANGMYLFDKLPPGSYTVTVAPSNFAAGGALTDYRQTYDYDGLLDHKTMYSLDLSEDFLDADFGYRPKYAPGTGTPGYWKNHPEAWPVQHITIGGITYTKAEAIAGMKAPTNKDKTYTMFQALVSAKLNVGIGNRSDVGNPMAQQTIRDADAWMAANPLGSKVKGSSTAWRLGEPLYLALDRYNNGMYPGAPHRR